MSDLMVDMGALPKEIREKLAELDLELSEGKLYGRIHTVAWIQMPETFSILTHTLTIHTLIVVCDHQSSLSPTYTHQHACTRRTDVIVCACMLYVHGFYLCRCQSHINSVFGDLSDFKGNFLQLDSNLPYTSYTEQFHIVYTVQYIPYIHEHGYYVLRCNTAQAHVTSNT